MSSKVFFKPYFAVFLSFVFCLIAIFFPPQIYEAIMKEQDYMFLNLKVVLLITLYTIAFYIGYIISPAIKLKQGYKSIKVYKSPLRKLIYLSIVFLSLISIYIFLFIYFLKKTFGLSILNLILIGYAYIKYSSPFIPFKLGGIPTLLAFSSIYLAYIYIQYKNKLTKSTKLIVSFTILIIFFINIITANRNPLFLSFLSILLIYNYYNNLSNFKLMYRFIKYFFITIIIFAITTVIRFSTIDINSILMNIIGYSISSVNRFAFQLNYNINLAPPNYGNKILNIAAWHNILKIYGFNYFYNLSTFYWEIYEKFRYISIFLFIIFGFISKQIYILFRKESLFAIILYPILYWSLVLLFITDVFFSNLEYVLYSVVFIYLLNIVFKLIILSKPTYNKHQLSRH